MGLKKMINKIIIIISILTYSILCASGIYTILIVMRTFVDTYEGIEWFVLKLGSMFIYLLFSIYSVKTYDSFINYLISKYS